MKVVNKKGYSYYFNNGSRLLDIPARYGTVAKRVLIDRKNKKYTDSKYFNKYLQAIKSYDKERYNSTRELTVRYQVKDELYQRLLKVFEKEERISLELFFESMMIIGSDHDIDKRLKHYENKHGIKKVDNS